MLDPETSAATPAGRPRDERRAQDEARAKRWRSIWISDLHLGTRECRSDLLLQFLEQHEAEYLYLVGDVVDGWNLRRRSWHWSDEHNRVLQAVLEKSSRGTRVTYVTGNHDEFLRAYAGLMLGGIAVKDETVHRTADGRELWVVHGDRFDAYVRSSWLAALGDNAYRIARALTGGLNVARRVLGLEPWSLARKLRERVKRGLSYVERFEHAIAAETRHRGLDGAVCGHIHHARIREIDGILYCNDGDWVESCTALVEDPSGRLSLLGAGHGSPQLAAVAGG